MRLGISTTDFDAMRAEALMERIVSLGLHCAQLSFMTVAEAGPEMDGVFEIPAGLDERAADIVGEAAARHGVSLVAVNGTYNMAHPDIAVRAEGLRRFETLCQAAKRLNIPVVTLSTGTRNRENLWRGCEANRSQAAWNAMQRSIMRAVRAAERYDLTLGVECEPNNVVDTPDAARLLLDQTGSERLGIVMDCANLFKKGMAKKENARDVIDFAFTLLGRDTVLAHGKDIRESEEIEFCRPGEGIVDYPFFVKKLEEFGYGGAMILHGIFEDEAIRRCVRDFTARLGLAP